MNNIQSLIIITISFIAWLRLSATTDPNVKIIWVAVTDSEENREMFANNPNITLVDIKNGILLGREIEPKENQELINPTQNNIENISNAVLNKDNIDGSNSLEFYQNIDSFNLLQNDLILFVLLIFIFYVFFIICAKLQLKYLSI